MLAAALATSHHHHCGDLSTHNIGDTCKSSWHSLRPRLRPTQNSVGYAWVFRIQLEDMSSEQDAQDEMDSKVVPVVLGADGIAYVIDHHHHLAALDLSGFEHVHVTIHVACDFSGLSNDELWQALETHAFAYLHARPAGEPDALPVPMSPRLLPPSISFRAGNVTMADDRWRALSSFSRKVKSCSGCDGLNGAGNSNHPCRAYDRGCAASGVSQPFFEFRWAYFYNVAFAVNTSLWGSEAAAREFGTAYRALQSPTPSAPATDVDDWQGAAALLVPLARDASAGAFALPKSMGAAMAGPLPGYRAGMSGFPADDPDCDMPSCTDAVR